MSAHAKLSASGSHRWLNCPGSIKAESSFSESSSPFAEEGTRAHEFAEHCLKLDVSPSESSADDVPPEMVGYVQEYVDYVLSLGSEPFVEQRVDYSRWVPEGFGTCDALLIVGTTLHIIDLKYGKGVKVYAEKNTQGMLYALGALTMFDDLFDIDSVVIHIVQPRLDHIDTWELGVGELLAFGEEASLKAKQALSDDAPRIPGDKQCQWCKAKATCPALLKMTEQTIMSHFDDESQPGSIDILTDEQLRTVMSNKKLIEGWLSAVESHIVERLNAGQTFEGYKLVEGRASRYWSDEDEAVKVLLEYKDESDIFETKLISVAKAEKLLGKKNASNLSDLIVKSSGKPTLAPESDKRPAINITIDDFKSC